MARQATLQGQHQKEKRTELANATEEDLVRDVGKLLTASAAIVAAHENNFGKEQRSQAIDEFNSLQDEWDRNEDVLKLRVETYFSTAPIQAKWTEVLDELGGLDEEIKSLNGFHVSERSSRHAQRIESCRKAMDKAQESLIELENMMTQFTQSR
ncbi:MAG: hypothetical protein WBQ76_03885 [Candidatus Korobacteraceae bacterium]